MSDYRKPTWTPPDGFLIDTPAKRITKKSAFLKRLEEKQQERTR